MSVVHKASICTNDRFIWFTFNFRLPINWRTPLRYLLVLICESGCVFMLTVVWSAFMCFFIGSSWILISLVEDITNDLSLLIRVKDTDSLREMKNDFYNIIQHHSNAKQLSEKRKKKSFHKTMKKFFKFLFISFRAANELSSIYEFIITGLFVWTTLTICSSLLVFEVTIVFILNLSFFSSFFEYHRMFRNRSI